MTQRTEAQPIGLRAALRSGRILTSALQILPDPGISTILGWSGCDYVLLDWEHGPYTLDSLRHCLDAVATTPAAAVVRVADGNPALIKQVLELGVGGILIPAIGTADQARAAVAACRYPPEGIRGTGTGRAERYGLSTASYRRVANSDTAVLIMVETREGVDNADDIANTPGIDGIFLGPHDLAADLGIEDSDDALNDYVQRVVTAATSHSVPVGTNAAPAEVPGLVATGMSLFLCYTDFAGLISSSTGAFAAVADQINEEASK